MIFSYFRGETLNVDAKLKLNVGRDNVADITLTGEATEAIKDFFNNGYVSALNGNMEFCNDEKCSRLLLCNTDLCNTYEPSEWKVSKVAHDCPAGEYTNGLGNLKIT